MAKAKAKTKTRSKAAPVKAKKAAPVKAKKAAPVKAKKAAPVKAKKAAPVEATKDELFECSDLALCVMEALVQQGLARASVTVPALAPDDDDDLDDESESWRDRVVDNQTAPIDTLIAELAKHRDKLPQVKEITGVIIEIADEYEPEIWSLAGVEALTGLEKIDLWSRDETLDLSPLTKLSALVEVDLSCASPKNQRPLLALPALKKVIGQIDATIADQLRQRGVEVETK
jgi:hypothetical protein